MESSTVWHRHSTRPSLPAGTARKDSGILPHGRRNRLIMQTTKNRKFPPVGNSLLYISLSYVDFSECVRVGAPCFFFLLCFIIFHAQHPISDTNMGLDQMRRIRVSFQFFAQGCHINTQGSNVIFLRTAPYFLREGGMRQHFAHIMRQHTQQFVLDGGQMQFILTQPDAPGREVDL